MSDQVVLKTSLGAVWVQPDGPNTQPYYVGCVDLGDITDPAGETELIQCFSEMGGWKTMGQKYTPPGLVTTQLDELLTAQRSYLEQINGIFSLIVLMRDGGRPDIFQNYVRAYIFENAKITSNNLTNLVHHTEDNESMAQMPISASPPLLKTGKLIVDRLPTTELLAANDIFFRPAPSLWNQIASGDVPGKFGITVCDGGAGAANVLYTANKGTTWAATATDPFGVGFNIESATAVFIAKATVRWIVARLFPAAGQGQAAYSDDNGTTWTIANVGGAVAGHGAVAGARNALFAIDQYNIFLASNLGYVYKSTDGGATWVAVEQGILTANPLQSIYFASPLVGMAGSSAGEVLLTQDGGLTWSLVTTPVASAIVSLQKSGEFWWAYTAANSLWFSSDDGTTWTQRTGYPAAGIGAGRDLVFTNTQIGYLLYNTAGPVGYVLRTIDGGYTWEALTLKANVGLNALFAADYNTVFAVGEATVAPATATIIRYSWS